MKSLKSLIVASLVLISGFAGAGVAFAGSKIGFDAGKCQAIWEIAHKLEQTYVSKNTSCQRDEDCHYAPSMNHVCSPGAIVNNVGKAGNELMLKSAAYQQLVEEQRNVLCPVPACAPRIDGNLSCIDNQCQFVPQL